MSNRPSRQQLEKCLYILEDTANRTRKALGLLGLSRSTEDDLLKSCISAVEMTYVILKKAVPPADEPKAEQPNPDPEQWKFQQTGAAEVANRRQCRALLSDGRGCRCAAQKGSAFCHHHKDAQLPSLGEVLSNISFEGPRE